MNKIRHTVIFAFREHTAEANKEELLRQLDNMGQWLTKNLDVTAWQVAGHIPESYKGGRANVLQDAIFPKYRSIKITFTIARA